MTTDEMQADIDRLAAPLGARIKYYDDMPWDAAHGHLDPPGVCTPPIVDEKTYAIALHELGHIATEPAGYDRTTPSMSTLLRFNIGTAPDFELAIAMEVAAWDWAKSQARAWTPPMADVERRAMASYTSNVDRAVRVPDAFALAAISISSNADLRSWARRRIVSVLTEMSQELGDQSAFLAALQKRWATHDALGAGKELAPAGAA